MCFASVKYHTNEQGGNGLTDAARRERLQPYAAELINFLRRQGGAVTAATASKHLKGTSGFHSSYGKCAELWRFHSPV